MDKVLFAIRDVKLRNHADCQSLLGCVVSRLADFDRCTPDVDLSAVLDLLADAEAELEKVYALDPADVLDSFESRRAA